MTLRDALEHDGFIIVRELLNEAEVSQLRAALTDHFLGSWRWEGLGKHQPDATRKISGIAWLLEDPRILQTLGELSVGAPVATSSCDAHMNMLGWWHKDIAAGPEGWISEEDFDFPCSEVIRVGIYLQPHPTGGLTVRRGSHRCPGIDAGEPVHLDTALGDVIFFDMRLTHAGQFIDPFEILLLRLGRRMKCEATAAAARRVYQRLKRQPDKLSIFLTFAERNSRLGLALCRHERAAERRAQAHQ